MSPQGPGRSQGRTWLAEHGATGWCLEQSRNQLQSRVQQLEELPEAPELYGVSRGHFTGDVSTLPCTSHFMGQDFTGNSEERHQAWLHTLCQPGRKEQRAQCPHPTGQEWQSQDGEKAEESPAAFGDPIPCTPFGNACCPVSHTHTTVLLRCHAATRRWISLRAGTGAVR